MLRTNAVKRKLQEGKIVYGLFSSIPAPLMVEMIGCAGYDFVIIDSEHVSINLETLENMIRAAEAINLAALVRVPDCSPGPILRALDAGAQGVVVPHVRSKEEAEAAVRASRYYPEGNRSLNSGRPAGFAKMDLPTYIRVANEEIMVVVMIEDREGVERIDEILSVPGIDMVLEGAADLSQSYGIPWQTRSPIVKEALKRVQESASRRGVPYCAIPRAEEDFPALYQQGIRAFVLGDERGVSFRAMSAHLNRYQMKAEALIKEREPLMNRVERYILSERENGRGSLPAFIYDLDDLREHVRRCVQTLPKPCRLFYAIKANSEEPILRALTPIVDGFEVASIGEIRKVRVIAPDIPIIFGGPGKTDEEIEGAIDHRVQLIHIESEHELRRVATIAARRNITVPILLRVNLKGPLPQATLAMAGRPTQFGIEEPEIPDVIRLAQQLPSVRVEGFHLHSISNNLDAEQHVRLVEYYCDRVKEWVEMFGLSISYLNAGGGIGINYTELDKQFDWDLFVRRLEFMLATKCPPGVTVLFECGRFLTAACGFYAVEVLDIKKNHGKHFVIVRGGTHQFRLPVSWQHSHPFRVLPVERWDYPFPRKVLTDAQITVVGQLCTPKDVLARDVYVSRVRIGDVILFSHAGAYGWAISHHDFLSHPHPRHIYLGETEKEAGDGGDSTHDQSIVHTPVD